MPASKNSGKPGKHLFQCKEARVSAKQARRLKQREMNLPRAQKMHLARMESQAQFQQDFLTPCAANKPKDRAIHIGCSGWFYWDWRGVFYPSQMPTSQWFDYYTKHFETVELNAPFYSWPAIATVKTWIRQARARPFIYTVKVCELITHIKQFKGTKELIKDFGMIADLLGEKMGCFLYQLPPSFHYTPARLKAISTQLEPDRRNVVEFRHSSWWNETVYKTFRQYNIIFCSCSGPALPEDLVKTAEDIYIRFHGTTRWYRHNYSEAELAQWARKIRASGAKNVWIYFNNDYEGYAIDNAQTLLHLLEDTS